MTCQQPEWIECRPKGDENQKYLKSIYEKVIITRGKIKNYFGISLNYATKGGIHISIIKDIKYMFDTFPNARV